MGLYALMLVIHAGYAVTQVSSFPALFSTQAVCEAQFEEIRKALELGYLDHACVPVVLAEPKAVK